MFGDSLSDTGNAYVGSLHDRAPSPPYFHGRFSDGPVWIEDFAQHFGLKAAAALKGGTNFAIGGAKAGSGADSLPHQADLYLLLSMFSPADPGALYVVFGGGNDIRSALKWADPAPALAAAAIGIRRTIEKLAARGAVNFLVPNVPDRGRTPAARLRGTAAAERALTIAFDGALDAALNDLTTRLRIDLIRVDLWSAVEQAFAAPRQWGFSNIADPCLTKRQGGYVRCADASTYVFWDDIHPTRRGHEFIAAAALAAYNAAMSQAPAASRDSQALRAAAAKSAALARLQSEVSRLVHDHLD